MLAHLHRYQSVLPRPRLLRTRIRRRSLEISALPRKNRVCSLLQSASNTSDFRPVGFPLNQLDLDLEFEGDNPFHTALIHLSSTCDSPVIDDGPEFIHTSIKSR